MHISCSDLTLTLTLMFADFDQLPSVGGPSIPEVAMMVLEKKLTKRNIIYNNKKWNVTTIIRQGVELVKTATDQTDDPTPIRRCRTHRLVGAYERGRDNNDP